MFPPLLLSKSEETFVLMHLEYFLFDFQNAHNSKLCVGDPIKYRCCYLGHTIASWKRVNLCKKCGELSVQSRHGSALKVQRFQIYS